MKKILTLLCVSAVLFAGCSKDDDPVVEFNLEWPSKIGFVSGEIQRFSFTTNVDYELAFTQPVGWKAEESDGKIAVTAPYATDGSAETGGTVTVNVLSGGKTLFSCSAEVTVEALALTLTFEDIPAEYLAGPTAKGENLYSDYPGTRYTGYSDTHTGLQWEINEAYGSREFWNGGVAVSRWTETTVNSWENQCSVYGEGGHDGSETFAVATGMKNEYGGDYSVIYFSDADTEAIFDSFRVANTTYAVLSMRYGDSFGVKAFSYEDKDWFKLIVTGFDKADTETGTVEYYLADFRTATAPGIVEGWHKVDLSTLGKAHKIAFSFESSDAGEWGINTPTYFCFDDLVIKK